MDLVKAATIFRFLNFSIFKTCIYLLIFGCGESTLLYVGCLVVVHRLIIAVASLVMEHRL